jgi:hypothetical protein
MPQPEDPFKQIPYEQPLTPPPRITYDRSLTPPPRIVYGSATSPPKRFHYAPAPSPATRIRYSSADHRPILTPARKRRQLKQGRAPNAVKKSTANHTPPTAALNLDASAHTIPEPDTVPEDEYVDNASAYQNLCDDPYNLESHSIDEPIPQDDESCKYSIFVDSVASDECSFLQLTQDIFIANEWNMQKDEATVRSLILPIALSTNALSVEMVPYT